MYGAQDQRNRNDIDIDARSLAGSQNQNVENQNRLSGADYNAIQQMDKRYVRFLYNMWNLLTRPRIDLRELNSVMQTYDLMQKDFVSDYLSVLFCPERPAIAKIPSIFPVPSSSFMTHLQTSLTTNASGNIAFTWNPFFLQDSSNNGLTAGPWSSFYVNNNAGLNGTGSSAFFLPNDIGYAQMPAGLYARYRIVGASVVVSYTGRMDIVSGIMGIGIGLNDAATPSSIGTPVADANSSVYGTFNYIDDLYFAKRTQAVNGCRAIYFPLDSRFLQFQDLGQFLNGFHIAFYGMGLPPSSQCLRCDFYVQLEATVQPSFNNYITQTPAGYSPSNWLETSSSMINKNPDIVTQGSSDIPLSGGMTGGAAGVGGIFSFAKKLLGQLAEAAKDVMGSSIGPIIDKIPHIDTVYRALTGLNDYVNPVVSNQSAINVGAQNLPAMGNSTTNNSALNSSLAASNSGALASWNPRESG